MRRALRMRQVRSGLAWALGVLAVLTGFSPAGGVTADATVRTAAKTGQTGQTRQIGPTGGAVTQPGHPATSATRGAEGTRGAESRTGSPAEGARTSARLRAPRAVLTTIVTVASERRGSDHHSALGILPGDPRARLGSTVAGTSGIDDAAHDRGSTGHDGRAPPVAQPG
ncbi:MAG TPA: hypothetical protein VI076_09135 [Actinopolymorphaceae bacterium]